MFCERSNFFYEFLSSKFSSRIFYPFFHEQFFHFCLCWKSRMIRSRNKKHTLPPHALKTGHCVHERILKCVPQMQHARDVWGWHHDGVRLAGEIVRIKKAALFPSSVNLVFVGLCLIGLRNIFSFHIARQFMEKVSILQAKLLGIRCSREG